MTTEYMQFPSDEVLKFFRAVQSCQKTPMEQVVEATYIQNMLTTFHDEIEESARLGMYYRLFDLYMGIAARPAFDESVMTIKRDLFKTAVALAGPVSNIRSMLLQALDNDERRLRRSRKPKPKHFN